MVRTILRHRVGLSYSIIAVGIVLYVLRRVFLPTFFELEGLPFTIAAPSVLNSCYNKPTLITCIDPVIVGLTILGVAIATARGNGVSIGFTLVLILMPTGLYFLLGPIQLVVILLLVIPVLIDYGMKLIFPEPTT